MSDSCTSGNDRLELESITSVVWTDDDGTQYRRVIDGGEIRDIPVRSR